MTNRQPTTRGRWWRFLLAAVAATLVALLGAGTASAATLPGVETRIGALNLRHGISGKFGSGSGPWAEGVGARSGGAMLSGRSPAGLLGKLGDWSNPQALAGELGDGWTGGFFEGPDDAIAAASRGPMEATLPAGTGPGHMVVTSPLG